MHRKSNEDSDQIVQVPRVIWLFVGHMSDSKFNVIFNNLSVAYGREHNALTVLPHRAIMSQTLGMIFHLVTLSLNWANQP